MLDSSQPWQVFISVALELETHMQWTLVVSIVLPTAVMLVLVVWHDLRAAL